VTTRLPEKADTPVGLDAALESGPPVRSLQNRIASLSFGVYPKRLL